MKTNVGVKRKFDDVATQAANSFLSLIRSIKQGNKEQFARLIALVPPVNLFQEEKNIFTAIAHSEFSVNQRLQLLRHLFQLANNPKVKDSLDLCINTCDLQQFFEDNRLPLINELVRYPSCGITQDLFDYLLETENLKAIQVLVKHRLDDVIELVEETTVPLITKNDKINVILKVCLEDLSFADSKVFNDISNGHESNPVPVIVSESIQKSDMISILSFHYSTKCINYNNNLPANSHSTTTQRSCNCYSVCTGCFCSDFSKLPKVAGKNLLDIDSVNYEAKEIQDENEITRTVAKICWQN